MVHVLLPHIAHLLLQEVAHQVLIAPEAADQEAADHILPLLHHALAVHQAEEVVPEVDVVN